MYKPYCHYYNELPGTVYMISNKKQTMAYCGWTEQILMLIVSVLQIMCIQSDYELKICIQTAE